MPLSAQRILDTASVAFRRGGIAGTGVADIMVAAGLTQGGFYRHFDSKDALIKESLGNSFDALRRLIEDWMGDREGPPALLAAIKDYLSLEHRDSPTCCPFVSLGSELARESRDVRDAATIGFASLVELVARNLPRLSPEAARREASVILSTMIGAMTVARLVADKDLSAAILMRARKILLERVRQSSPSASGRFSGNRP